VGAYASGSRKGGVEAEVFGCADGSGDCRRDRRVDRRRVDGCADCVRSSCRCRINVGSTVRLRNDRTFGSISERGVRRRFCCQSLSNSNRKKVVIEESGIFLLTKHCRHVL
jgi:hypothetical protein